MRTRLASLLLVLAVSWAQPRPAFAQIKDTDLGEAVARVVQRYPHVTVFDDVTVTVSNRCVTLTGWVTEPYKRDELGRLASRVDGTRTFTNAIVVLPVSITDDELRKRVAKAIYGNSMFWRYASMTYPPIHIIVESGNVILTGCVSDENERRMAYALAHVMGASTIRNDLRLDR